MSAAKIVTIIYLAGMTFGAGGLLLLLATVLQTILNKTQYQQLTVSGMFLGFALAMIAFGIQKIAVAVYWVKNKNETRHV